MIKKIFSLLALAALMTGCISVDVDSTPATPAVDGFVTATIPPTKSGFVPSTATPTLQATLPPTPAVTAPPNCKDAAILLRDVTIQDDTVVNAGETFTKTWEFQNSGTCPWVNYELVFSSGDKMNTPLKTAIPTTLEGEKVQVSVELTAPQSNGTYTGFFTLNDTDGKVIPIGIEEAFWVRIIVGTAGISTPAGGTSTGSSGGTNCNYSQNAGYTAQLESLINAERAKAGLAPLTSNPVLAGIAQAHAADMACNSMISHTGSDGSSVYGRFQAAGYAGSHSEEIIYGGGGPQAAMSWWMSDQIHRDAILNPDTKEFGAGYAYFSNGSYGDYIAVEFGSP